MKIVKKYYEFGKRTLSKFNTSIVNKENLKLLKKIKNNFKQLKIKTIKSNTKVFDWKVPNEWSVNKAFVEDKYGKKIIDINKNFLHLVSHSAKKNTILKKKDLLNILHFNNLDKEAIPYVTSFYKKGYYGFCVSKNQKNEIQKKYNNHDKFKINIDTSFNKNGKMYYGELVLKGESKKEILISTYICHPIMANNETSGIIVSLSLIDYFKKRRLKKTLRFIFISETIGSLAYLNKNLKNLKKNCIGAFNLTCIGDERMHSCMLSKYQNSLSDLSLIDAYKKLKIQPKKFNFLKRGSDERQFNSPNIDIPMTSIFRSKYGEYKEYHTSSDNFDFVTPKGCYGGYIVAREAISNLLKMIIPVSKFSGEPNLGKRKMYPLILKNKKSKKIRSILDFLVFSDGKNNLSDISKKINLNYKQTKKISDLLLKKNLIET